MVDLKSCWLAGTAEGLYWSQDGAAWLRAGGYPFRVTSIRRSGDRTVVSVGSGLWDAGDGPDARWTQLHDETLTEVLDFSWCEGDPGLLAASTYGVARGFRDAAGAVRWTFLSDDLPVNRRYTNALATIPSGDGDLAVGTEDGVLRLDPREGTWQETSLAGFPVRTLIRTGDTVYAGSDEHGVWRSADGVTWTRAGSGMETETVFSLAEAGDGLLAGTEHGVWTGDGEGAWRRVGLDVRIAAVAGNAETWMAGGLPGGIWRTTDGGDSWCQAANVPTHLEALVAPERT